MVGRDDDQWVIWPHYFDKALTRRQGRRVSASLAVDGPKLGHVAQAARTLGLAVELDDDARPSSAWYEKKGRLLVKKTDDSKESVLQQIARRL